MRHSTHMHYTSIAPTVRPRTPNFREWVVVSLAHALSAVVIQTAGMRSSVPQQAALEDMTHGYNMMA